MDKLLKLSPEILAWLNPTPWEQRGCGLRAYGRALHYYREQRHLVREVLGSMPPEKFKVK